MACSLPLLDGLIDEIRKAGSTQGPVLEREKG